MKKPSGLKAILPSKKIKKLTFAGRLQALQTLIDEKLLNWKDAIKLLKGKSNESRKTSKTRKSN